MIKNSRVTVMVLMILKLKKYGADHEKMVNVHITLENHCTQKAQSSQVGCSQQGPKLKILCFGLLLSIHIIH